MSIAPFPRPLRLQKTAASLIGAIGAYVVRRLAPVVLRLQTKYESAPSGSVRLIAALQFKAAIEFYHLAFKIAKRGQQIKLRLSGVDEVLLELEGQFGHLGGRYPALIAPFRKLPELFEDIGTVLDEIEAKICSLKKTIDIHPSNPRFDPAAIMAPRKQKVESGNENSSDGGTFQ